MGTRALNLKVYTRNRRVRAHVIACAQKRRAIVYLLGVHVMRRDVQSTGFRVVSRVHGDPARCLQAWPPFLLFQARPATGYRFACAHVTALARTCARRAGSRALTYEDSRMIRLDLEADYAPCRLSRPLSFSSASAEIPTIRIEMPVTELIRAASV